MTDYTPDDHLDFAHDAEGDDNTEPDVLDAELVRRANEWVDRIEQLLPLSYYDSSIPEPLTDDPRDVRYPGRMTAFPDTPDEDLF